MGCTLIRRDAITKMLAAYPELIDTRLDLHPAKEIMRSTGANRILRLFDLMDIPERGRVSEDLSFCMRWNRIGGQVWAAIGYRISHVGPHDFGARYLDEVERKQQEEALAAAAALGVPTAPNVVNLPAPPLQQHMSGAAA
jgi:hypothetical protein